MDDAVLDWTPDRRMNALQYREIIDALGLSQADAGRFLGVSVRTSARYATGTTEIPEGYALLLRVCLRAGISPVVPNWRRRRAR